MKNVVIIGSGVAGKLLQDDINRNHKNVCILGFVDDITSSTKNFLGKIDELERISHTYNVDEFIVAIPSASGELIRKILICLSSNNIPIKLIPRTQETITKDYVLYQSITDFSCEDFLGNSLKKQESRLLADTYKGKTILVTGGAGSIGSEIVKQLIELDAHKIIIYDNSELGTFNLEQRLKENNVNQNLYKFIIGSVTNAKKLDTVIADIQPDIIFHAAAYKHVYLMEDNIDEAIINNVIGTKNVVDFAIKHDVKNFVFISTDKVVNPTSVMGATKKLSEFYIKQFNNSKTKFNIVRFGNVINSNGSVLPLFEYQLAKYNFLTVTHTEVKRFFMSIRDAAHLVISSITRGSDGEIYILNMGELIKIHDVAVCLIRSKNLIPHKDIMIYIIGLKKGEKMIEELFTESEMKNLEVTEIDNVYRIKNHDEYIGDINHVISTLNEMVTKHISQTNIKKFLQQKFPSLGN